jgi:hypothetical protein
LGLLFGIGFVPVARAAGCDPRTPAMFVAGITVIEGKIRVDFSDNGSRLKLTQMDRLTPCLPKPLGENAIKQILAKDLDSALAQTVPFYFFGLTTEEKKAGRPNKALDPCVLKTSPWPQFLKCYEAWTGSQDKAPGILRSYLWNGMRADIGALELARARTDFAQAEVTFRVKAFGGNWSDRLPDPLPKVSHAKRADLVVYLKRFDNGLWRHDVIHQVLVDFFARRGWAPTIDVSSAAGSTHPTIAITDSPQVVQVTFSPSAKRADDRDRLLYVLLPTGQFEKVAALPVKNHEGQLPYETIDLTGTSPPPVFNKLAFASLTPDLTALGFTATPLNTDTGINLQVEQNKKASVKTELSVRSGPVPDAPATDQQPPASRTPTTLAVSGNKAPIKRHSVERPCLSAPADSDEACTLDPLPRDKTRFVGGGFDYIPGEGVRPLVAFDWSRLAGTGGIGIEAGAANQHMFGTGSASFDFIGFGHGKGRLHHRLSLTLNGGTDVTANRLFGTRPLNDRRNGGTAHLQYELLRNRLGHSLYLYADAGDQNIQLTNVTSGALALTDNLASFAFGAVHTISRIGSTRPYRLRLEPKIRVGHAGAGSFYRTILAASYHQESLGAFAFDWNGRFEAASSGTPIYELPSFGGAGVMRGFRPDEFLGRELWSAQPEIWAPVPGLSDAGGSVSQFITRSVRLATFCDVGGVYDAFEVPSPVKPGLKGAPGAGIRVIYNQITLRLDWAYGIGRAPGGPPLGRFYFSVSTPLF